MKKLFFIFFSIFLISSLSTIYAWDDCPHGITDSSCKFPGRCGNYIDTNHDGICDHCEPAPTMSGAPSNIPPSGETPISEDIINKYVPTPSSELKNYTIKQVCEKYNISQDCLINALKSKINKINEMNKSSPSDEIPDKNNQLKETLINELNENTTLNEIKEVYGLSSTDLKEAILNCMIDEGIVSMNITQNSSTNDNNLNTFKSIIDKIIKFLFTELNLRDLFKF